MISRFLKNSLRIGLPLLLALLPMVAGAQITVGGISSSNSTCPNNGSITVNASTLSPPLLYSIVAGPVTQPVQSNPVFNSLPPGNYSVKLTDGAGNTTTLPITVTGTYVNPDYTNTTVRPYCVGNADGQITAVPVPGTGLGPFTWQLIAPSPVTSAPQAGNQFTGLPAGNYTLRMADACGSYKTSVITLANPNTQNPFYGGVIANKVGCDSMHFQFPLLIQDARPPLTVVYETATSTHTYTVSTLPNTAGFSYIEHVVPGISYGEMVTVTVYNDCGNMEQTFLEINPFTFYPTIAFNNCGSAATLSYVIDPNVFDTGVMPPLIYTVTDMATNATVDQGSVAVTPPANLYNTYISGITTSAVAVGHTYHITITDGCGEQFNTQYTVPSMAAPAIINKNLSQRACIDSVAGLYYVETVGFTNGQLILTSGPATLGSTKPDFEYSDTYTYPDTIPYGGSNYWLLNNLTLGTYYFTIIDQCGYQLSDSIVIHPIQVSNLLRELSYKKGCLGQNSIYFGMQEEGKVTVTYLPTHTVMAEKNMYNSLIQYNRDSVTNIPSGQYEVMFEFRQGGYGTYVNDSLHSCWIIRDTIDIEDYTPPQMTTGNAIMCNQDINLVLYPDTATGVPTYEYEIIAGPQTFPPQLSNVFIINQPGTYTARIYDACGNASTKQITVDTISFDPIQAFTDCNNAIFAFPPSDYFTYHWLMPNGQTFVGDSLILVPVTPADTGTYHISKVIDINGCVDTLYTTYHVGLGIQVTDTVHFCPGSTVTIGNHTYSLPGIYTDTLASAAGCDSIVVNHLILNQPLMDTLQVSICQGDSVQIAGIYQHLPGFYADSVQNASGCYDITFTDLTVHQSIDTVTASICNGTTYTWGNGSYQTAGFYRDTLVSALGCDSILVLSLSLTNYIQHAVSDSICPGGYYLFGTDTLTQTGVYADTLTTATCDSIVTLTLTALPYKQHAFADSICPGQSYLFGGVQLQQSGTYVDTLATAGCDSIVTLTLTALPYKTGTVNQTICTEESYLFGGQALNQTGTYIDTLSTATCDSIVTLHLTVLPNKYQALARSICEGESLALGDNLYTQPGVYTDTLSTPTCDSIVTVTLTVLPLPHDTVHGVLCGPDKYLLNGIYYSQPGMYTQRFPTGQCDSVVILYLQSFPGPSVNIVANVYETGNGATVHLQAQSATQPLNYQWTSSVVINNPNSINPTASIQGPTWIYLTVTDANGCTDTAAYEVTIPLTSTLFIPNTYTPNGDFMNGMFRIYGTNIKEFEIMIFDRWGELIFQSSDMDFGWNGTYMGESVQNGMYVYKILARGMDNTLYNQIGHITVLR